MRPSRILREVTLKVIFIPRAVFPWQVVPSLGSLTDEVLSVPVSVGQPEGPPPADPERFSIARSLAMGLV